MFNIKLQAPRKSRMQMASFPGAQEYVGAVGALVPSETTVPCQQGTVVPFRCQDLSKELQHVEENGGKVLLPKTDIGETDYFAHFCDTEGNRISFHSIQ